MDETTKHKIRRAHFFISNDRTKEFSATDYLVEFENIKEILDRNLKKSGNNEYLKFFSDSGETISYSYSEFINEVNKFSSFLIEKGITRENRVATFSHNHSDTVILYFALWKIGGVVVPINVNEEPDRVEYILENSESKLVFTRNEYENKLSGLNLKNCIPVSFEKIKNEISGYESKLDELNNKIEKFDKETEAMIVYTSGTTGNPKGVVLTQYNLMVDAKYISEWHNVQTGDTMMCVLPIHHVNGTVVTIMTTMYAGARLVLNQKFNTEKFLERIANEKVKVVSVVPTLLAFMLNSGIDRKNYDLTNFSHIICGAGPLNCELAKNFETKFKMRIVHGYGLSETTCYSCFIPMDLTEENHNRWQNEFGFPSIGIAIDCNEMDIQDEHGNSLNEGEKGEIVIRGHNVMKYYFNNEEVNRKTFEYEWFRSGDEGFFKYDNTGYKYFFITGRLKELFIRGGVNISPLEIDEVLSGIDYIKSAISVGFENDWYGEEVGALVMLNDEIDGKPEDEKEKIKDYILKECGKKLPFYKTPKVVIFSDSIPVTSTGKYQRNKVKNLFKEWKGVQFKK
ncbi:MAG TPA: long-chain fatty acid--CoA ligase [Bacteroidetes bacterium]|nr:long-chain fatty acid--CoA ligase [Bacteroidota bacterium]